jgi:DNA processing protein
MALTKEQQDWLTLSLVPGVGTTYFVRLLARFKRPSAVLKASEAALKDVVGPKLAQRIRAYQDVVDLNRQMQLLEEYQADLVTMEDTRYPTALAEIYDPPLALFVRGDLREEDAHAVAIVGTRKASPYGWQMANKLGRDLAARGITVVSGMASGTDTAAHEGALEAGGRTIAVLGCGVDKVYPAENAELMHRILQQGAVVSSFAMGVKPSAGHFPHRNRLISGLTLGTVVVEAPRSSGALITARRAAEQGREVFAIPGQVGNRNSLGPHALLREGAKLVETVDDILVELAVPAASRQPAHRTETPAAERIPAPTPAAAKPTVPEPPPAPAPPKVAVNDQEKTVLGMLSRDGSFVDEIALACRLSVSEALSTLTMLELKGLVRQFAGKRFAPR